MARSGGNIAHRMACCPRPNNGRIRNDRWGTTLTWSRIHTRALLRGTHHHYIINEYD